MTFKVNNLPPLLTPNSKPIGNANLSDNYYINKTQKLSKLPIGSTNSDPLVLKLKAYVPCNA